jgi:hypothetical protein
MGIGTVTLAYPGANIEFVAAFADYTEDQQVAYTQAIAVYVFQVLASGTTSANYIQLSPNLYIVNSTLDVIISQIPSFN